MERILAGALHGGAQAHALVLPLGLRLESVPRAGEVGGVAALSNGEQLPHYCGRDASVTLHLVAR